MTSHSSDGYCEQKYTVACVPKHSLPERMQLFLYATRSPATSKDRPWNWSDRIHLVQNLAALIFAKCRAVLASY